MAATELRWTIMENLAKPRAAERSSASSTEAPSQAGALVRLGACIFAIACTFYLTLSSAPAHLALLGGDAAAGAATTLFTFSTVVSSLLAPGLVARFGRHAVFAVAAIGLGLPCFAVFGASLALAAAACAVRGAALGLAFVATGGLAAKLAPASRRGAVLGAFGTVFSVPSIFAVPAGLWLLSHTGPLAVAWIACACATAPLLGLAVFPARAERAPHDASTWRLPWAALAWPVVAQAGGAAAVGAMITALASTVASGSSTPIALAMSLHGLAVALATWRGGRLGDRYGQGRLIVAGSCLSFVALSAFGVAHSTVALLVGAGGLGMAFGFQQNGTLTLMVARAQAPSVDSVNALWNIAYDAGIGLGALAFGCITPVLGDRATFAAIAVFIATTNALGFALWKRLPFQRKDPT